VDLRFDPWGGGSGTHQRRGKVMGRKKMKVEKDMGGGSDCTSHSESSSPHHSLSLYNPGGEVRKGR